MMKKLLRGAFAALFALGCLSVGALAAGEGFSTVRVDLAPDAGLHMSWHEQEMLRLRYADDKAPVPLSFYYDGSVFGTVPDVWKGRPVEAYQAEGLQFTDSTAESSYRFHWLMELSRTGVITGNGKGEALPGQPITRAEAAAILVRALGVPMADGAASGYRDVPADAWYAPAVATAKEYGIVAPDTSFAPDRLVSREELVTMAARMFARLGMARLDPDAAPGTLYQDADDISGWARPAYAEFEITSYAYSQTKTDEEGAPLVSYYAYPQQPATREDAAELLGRNMENRPCYPSAAARAFGFDQAMPSIDGSTSTHPFTDAVYGALFRNGTHHPQYPAKHSKSHASYERLINGEVDMLFASVYPASDILALAKEKGVELELIPIAYDAMVFFTNVGNPATGLTSKQISSIYVNNAYGNWSALGGPDALLYPYCRNNDSGSHAQMERHFLDGHEIHPAIRAETTSLSMQSVLTDVISAETQEPRGYGLGYSIYYYFWNADTVLGTAHDLKLLAVDGVAPTDETIADGSYPLSNNTYVVLRADTPAGAPARQMADFMLTEAGQDCVRSAGFGPLSPAALDAH